MRIVARYFFVLAVGLLFVECTPSSQTTDSPSAQSPNPSESSSNNKKETTVTRFLLSDRERNHSMLSIDMEKDLSPESADEKVMVGHVQELDVKGYAVFGVTAAQRILLEEVEAALPEVIAKEKGVARRFPKSTVMTCELRDRCAEKHALFDYGYADQPAAYNKSRNAIIYLHFNDAENKYELKERSVDADDERIIFSSASRMKLLPERGSSLYQSYDEVIAVRNESTQSISVIHLDDATPQQICEPCSGFWYDVAPSRPLLIVSAIRDDKTWKVYDPLSGRLVEQADPLAESFVTTYIPDTDELFILGSFVGIILDEPQKKAVPYLVKLGDGTVREFRANDGATILGVAAYADGRYLVKTPQGLGWLSPDGTMEYVLPLKGLTSTSLVIFYPRKNRVLVDTTLYDLISGEPIAALEKMNLVLSSYYQPSEETLDWYYGRYLLVQKYDEGSRQMVLGIIDQPMIDQLSKGSVLQPYVLGSTKAAIERATLMTREVVN